MNESSSSDGSAEFCSFETTTAAVLANTTASASAASCDETFEQTSPSGGTHPAALFFLVIARMLNGLGNSGTTVLSVAYIDENTSKTKSPLYIGVSRRRID